MVKEIKTGSRPAYDDIDLGRLFGVLLDNKWLIMLVTAVFAVAAVIHVQLATPIYRADALVQVEGKTGLSNPLTEVRSILEEETKAEAELEILRSRMVLGQAVDQERLDIEVIPTRMAVVGDYLVRRGMERPGFAQRSVWAGEHLNVGELRVDQEWLGRALRLVTGEAGSYRLYHGETLLGEGQVGTTESFDEGRIELRVAELQAGEGAEFTVVRRTRLAAINSLRSRFSVGQRGRDSGVFNMTLLDENPRRAERTLSAISQIYLTQNVERQSAEAQQSLEFLEEQVPQVRNDLAAAEDALNAFRMEHDSLDLNLETRSVLDRVVELDTQLGELEMEQAELSQRYNASHPLYAALMEKRNNLERDRERLNERIHGLPETQQQILRMTRDVEVTQQVYVQLLNKIQEMNITKASTVGNVRILDDAVAQPGPVEPRKPVTVAMLTLVGAFLAVAFVILRSILHRGVESAEQIEDLGLPVYATVPLSDDQQKLVRRVKRHNRRRGRAVTNGVLAQNAPDDTAIEALRGLRTSLHFAMLEANDNRLMITGPSPNIGKSFISINLGAVIAQSGQRVLIVDADMRKGHVHTAFNADSKGGLSEVLSDKAGLDEVIRQSPINGLCYVARGKAPPNPAELLMSERFTRLLDAVSERFDLVIVDTPPILAVTDAAVIGHHCGTTLMVARFGLNPPREVDVAIRRLETSGVSVKGGILNAIERKAATSYGYGYYHYAYKTTQT
ncbi:MAG: polysaccharide biosynthesis tyrosine autokinase [Halomonas sp.]|uniref:Polysaccharide biosynthesis tyrosine autokinase n=2 Tax=Halomonadaceae TaxID=28256 RepID=A0ABS6ZPC8_9GAMM|nr:MULTISPECIES: polysaccharide biosynthesis tyrosine autokinase [Halomonas]MBW6391931.1 polysaccharide biosynthesis tyrosine autokinase [Halomonas antri]MDX5377528.1 polysaccharide biosynthesis tyrosine autokinase [Halomonas sp.]QTP58969.1 polysaccharide biosynthesis tyrosine autokinase [Halomonas sulfidivorans]